MSLDKCPRCLWPEPASMQTLLGISQAMSFETARLNEFERAQLAKAAVKAAADIFNADTPGLTPLPAPHDTSTLSGMYGEVQVTGTREAVNKFIESIAREDKVPSSVADLRATVRWLTTECAELRKTIEHYSSREKAVKQVIDGMRAVVEDFPT